MRCCFARTELNYQNTHTHTNKAQQAYIVFRGTESARDMLADLDIRREALGEGKVHAGFIRQYRSIEDVLKPSVEALAESGALDTALFIGHSLGGGLATLGAGFLGRSLRARGVRVALHTFGSPRVGNAPFAGYVRANCCEVWRVHNEQDPVALIPITGVMRQVGATKPRAAAVSSTLRKKRPLRARSPL